MNIDWKHLATTPGYKSLKAAYCIDVTKERTLRSKQELYKHFQWVIYRAKHYANTTGVSIDTVLNAWEEKRDYWWLNYYQDSNQPKKHSASPTPWSINAYRKYFKKRHWTGSTYLPKHLVNDLIKKQHKETSKKIKKRWSTEKKKYHQRIQRL